MLNTKKIIYKMQPVECVLLTLLGAFLCVRFLQTSQKTLKHNGHTLYSDSRSSQTDRFLVHESCALRDVDIEVFPENEKTEEKWKFTVSVQPPGASHSQCFVVRDLCGDRCMLWKDTKTIIPAKSTITIRRDGSFPPNIISLNFLHAGI